MLNRRGAERAAFAVAVLMASVSMAKAQTPPPAPAPVAPAPSVGGALMFGGPSVPGVCVMSQQAVLTSSKVGMAATARLRQLQQQVQAGLVSSRASIDNAMKTLAAERSTQPEAVLEQKARALDQRRQALQITAQERSQQLEATQAEALKRIGDEARPGMVVAYQAHGCGVLFDRAAVIEGGMGMDITDAVIKALDARISAISFDLARAPGADH